MVALGGLFSLMSTCVDVTVRIGVGAFFHQQ